MPEDLIKMAYVTREQGKRVEGLAMDCGLCMREPNKRRLRFLIRSGILVLIRSMFVGQADSNGVKTESSERRWSTTRIGP
jgi:hypothetical protein